VDGSKVSFMTGFSDQRGSQFGRSDEINLADNRRLPGQKTNKFSSQFFNVESQSGS
jgi:hypothetical protein